MFEPYLYECPAQNHWIWLIPVFDCLTTKHDQWGNPTIFNLIPPTSNIPQTQTLMQCIGCIHVRGTVMEGII